MASAIRTSQRGTRAAIVTETATVFLPSRRPVDVAGLARTCVPPWHPWRGGALARAERTSDGRVHRLVVRRQRGGVVVVLTGVGAASAERLAPVAARVRRALRLDRDDGLRDGGLRGTSAFEDAVQALLADVAALPSIRRRVVGLGHPCPAARALRTMPAAADVLRVPRRALAARLGSAGLARRLQALARAFAAIAPCSPSDA
jgi:hypothetical protein